MAQNGYDTGEVYRASTDAVADTVRLMITVAMIAADLAVERRRQRLAEESAAAEERARVAMEQLRAERAAAEHVLKAVHQERFWQDADPRRIGRAWQAAGQWADSDPYAAYTMEVLRERLLEKFGIEAPIWTAGGADLARIVTVAKPHFQATLEKARTAAENSGEVSYAVLVRDRDDPYRTVYQGEVSAPAGMPVDAVAAREFSRWAEGPGAEHGAEDAGRFAVELVENTDNSARAAQTVAAQVRGDQAAQVLAGEEAWQRALIDGSQHGTDAELLYALTAELDRLEAEEAIRAERRAEYVVRLDDEDLDPRDRARLASNVDAIDTGLTALHQQQADTALRVAATAAAVRGENPQHVYDAAQLTDSLDDGWWQTANAREIAGIWEHVQKWDPSQAREEMTQALREGVERHHGLLVPKDATADMVGALFGGRDALGPATPLTRRAQELRDQAEALYDDVFDAQSEWIELERRMAAQPGTDEDQQRQMLEMLEARVEAVSEHADALWFQSVWLEENSPQAMKLIYEQNNDEAVRELAAEFEERWGRPLGAEKVQQLAEAAAQAQSGADPWAIVSGVGSVDPAAVTIPARQMTGGVESATAETAEPPEPPPVPAMPAENGARVDIADEGTRRNLAEHDDWASVYAWDVGPAPDETAAGPDSGVSAEREAARREAAQNALNGISDTEAVEAARLTQAAFPQGPEGAVAQPPQTGGVAGTGSSPGLQRTTQVEL